MFSHAKGKCPADISCEIISVYGNIMSRQNVMKWHCAFSECKTGAHEEHRTDKPFATSYVLLQRNNSNK